MEGKEELMMKGGMTCGLSDIVVSIMSKYLLIFLLPVPPLLDLSFFLFIFLAYFFSFW